MSKSRGPIRASGNPPVVSPNPSATNVGKPVPTTVCTGKITAHGIIDPPTGLSTCEGKTTGQSMSGTFTIPPHPLPNDNSYVGTTTCDGIGGIRTYPRPYIGDPLPEPYSFPPLIGDDLGDVNRIVGPNPVDTTFWPVIPSSVVYTVNRQFWGVQKKSQYGGYMIVQPEAMSLLDQITSHDTSIVARCETQELAQVIADTLNRKPQWGVQKKAVNSDKDGPDYFVVNPQTASAGLVFPGIPMFAYCDTEEMAEVLADHLNSKQWGVGKLNTGGDDSDEFVLLSPDNLRKYKGKLADVSYRSSMEEAQALTDVLNKTQKPGNVTVGLTSEGTYVAITPEKAQQHPDLFTQTMKRAHFFADGTRDAQLLADMLNWKTKAWGIARRTHISQGPHTFMAISPAARTMRGDPYDCVAYAENENDARALARAMHWAAIDEAEAAKPKAQDETSVKSDVRIHLNHFNHVVKNLTGRVLTIVDASFGQETQRKAVVSLVKKEARQTLSEMFKYVVIDEGNSTSSDGGQDVDLSE